MTKGRHWRPFCVMREVKLTAGFGQIARHGALHALPDGPAVFTVVTHAIHHLIVRLFMAQRRQLAVESQRQLAGLRI